MTKPNPSVPKDPFTGKFVPGNPGRPKGAKNRRTMQWGEFGDALVSEHAGQFSTVLERLLASDKVNDQVKGAELFLKVLEYFKPKRPREAPLPDPWDLDNLLGSRRP